MMYRFEMPARIYDVEAKDLDQAKARFQEKFGYYPSNLEVVEIKPYR